MTPTEIAARVAVTAVDALPALLVELALVESPAGDGGPEAADATAFAAGLIRRRMLRPSSGPGVVVAVCVTWPTLTTVACRAELDDPEWFAALEVHPDAIIDGRWWVGPMTYGQMSRLDAELPSQRFVVAEFDPSDPPGYVALVWELHRHEVQDPRPVALAVLAEAAD